MNDSGYCYPPDFKVLKNKLGIQDSENLEIVERLYVKERNDEGCPSGDFDFNHLKAIHYHLFQDIYEWAGKTRTVEISKGNQQFQLSKYIDVGMNDIHQRIVKANYLQNLNPEEFANKAAEILGDINYVHPFREGNGRTQLQYLKQLATQAGYDLDVTKLEPTGWIQASQASHKGEYNQMAECLLKSIITINK